MATQIIFAHKRQPLPLDKLFVTGDKEDVKRQISAVYNFYNLYIQEFSC